jgi:hypothetical protein
MTVLTIISKHPMRFRAIKGYEGASKKALLGNITFDFDVNLDPPSDTTLKAIGSKWVFKTKINPNGTIEYKARQ